MPKSYVEVGSCNRNVMGKNISFFHFSEQSKKESGVGKTCKRVSADGSPWYLEGTYAYIF